MEQAITPILRTTRAMVISVAVTTGVVAVGPMAFAAPESYSFLNDNSASNAARWDPCTPIGYRVNTSQMPADALPDVVEAAARLSSATGMEFRYLGTTTVVPDNYVGYPSDTDAIVSWNRPGESKHLPADSNAAGMGGARWTSGFKADGSRASRIFKGYVVMNSSTDGLTAGFTDTDGRSRGAILMHELGHMAGLGHTSDNTQVMNTPAFVNSYGDGDRNGLAILGRGQGCLYKTKEEAAAGSAAAPEVGPTASPTQTHSPSPTQPTQSPGPTQSPTATQAPSPPQSATPGSATTPTATPAATATATQATPAPTSAAPAHDVPSVTVNPFVVKFGETANVTITGTPGAKVDLYIRKFRGEFVKIRDGLVLDSTGRTTVVTRPDMNLRFMAKDRTVTQGSSVGGADGLMTVEKYVSINVQRVGVNRFTFRGSINPMHPGAVVHLYRNGSLIRSNIAVSSSRVYTFTGTLPAGTGSFRITSPTTGYNNVSHSPTRTVRIY